MLRFAEVKKIGVTKRENDLAISALYWYIISKGYLFCNLNLTIFITQYRWGESAIFLSFPTAVFLYLFNMLGLKFQTNNYIYFLYEPDLFFPWLGIFKIHIGQRGKKTFSVQLDCLILASCETFSSISSESSKSDIS